MADAPIGITFLPTAAAQANGQRQSSIEGQGGSDLAQAFKILSLHLPRVLGASAIAPKRLLTSAGSAGVAGPTGASPYAQVFQSLLQSLSGGMSNGGGDLASSLSSIYGATPDYGASPDRMFGGIPAPNINPGTVGDIYNAPRAGEMDTTPTPAPTPSYDYQPPDRTDTQYI